MAQQKSNAAKSPGNTGSRKTPVKPESRPDNRERYTVKPEFWDGVLDSLPPWIDEIAAILLIVFGIVSFLSLLNVSSDATISAAWSNALTSLFGWGSVIVSAGIFLLGVIMLLPKLGVVVRFPARRILALELAFFSLLALLHLLVGDPELRALARARQGGGQVGWALSAPFAGPLGSGMGILFYGALFLIAVGAVTGVRSRQVSAWLRSLHARMAAYGEAMAQRAETARAQRQAAEPPPPPDPFGGALRSLENAQVKRPLVIPIMRVRFDPARVPPSARLASAAAPADEEETGEITRPAPAPDHALFVRREASPAFNAIGTIKGKKNRDGVMMVERPDGRLKRFFTVAGMKEAKHVGKRSPELPPLNLLRDLELYLPDEEEINRNVVLIENTLLEFDIDVDVVDVKVGPTVTQYAVQPFREMTDEAGETMMSRTRISKIASLSSDLALALSAKRLRLETPVPGHTYVGIEVPNRNPSIVALRSVYESRAHHEMAQKNRSPLLIPLGRDVSGAPYSVDLAKMPHLLIAGTTGSGKSVCMAAIATALVLSNTPDTVKLIMLDPKMVELSRFNGLPHLLGPVETDAERIIGVLRWCMREMDRRYKLLEAQSARNIDIYNAKLGRRRKEDYMPHVVIMVDEIGDLMLSRPDETEKPVVRLAQMARAVGMHLIVATQRPSVDVITGLIKANFPSRMSFAVASGIDSRVILDAIGAESLMGKGDLLFMPADAMAPLRLQGCYVSDDEVRAVVEWWKQWQETQAVEGKPADTGIGPWERGLTRREFLAETDPMLEQAISLVIAEGEASASLIQRRMGLGYPRAARIMDLLAELGIVGEVKADRRSREVLIKPGEDPFKDLIDRRMKGQ